MTVKYAVYAGYTTSKTDGQDHFVSAKQLMFLYGVRQDECLIVPHHRTGHPSEYAHLDERAAKLIALRPRFDGDYTLPSCV